MATPPSANEQLSGSYKFRSLSFKGDRPPVEYYNLRVEAEPETIQDRDDKMSPLWWGIDSEKGKKVTHDTGDNNIIWVYSLKLQLLGDFRPDPRIEDLYGEDDGIRYWYFGGSKKSGSGTGWDAWASAIRKAGAKGCFPGGVFKRIAWVGGGEDLGLTTTQKLYEAEYVPPPPGYRADAPRANTTVRQAQEDPYADVPPPSSAPPDEPPF